MMRTDPFSSQGKNEGKESKFSPEPTISTTEA
jgi:hypothetical protein